MKIIFYDVEHGSCCHIITPHNKHILVDVGSKTDSSIVKHIRNKYFNGNRRSIDELIITHPHVDHIYDLPNLMTLLPPDVLLRTPVPFEIKPDKTNPTHADVVTVWNKINKDYNQPVAFDTAPINAQVNGGVEFSIIFPKKEWTTQDDLNSFSSIIVIKYSGYKFILTGDNPSSILKEMITINHENIKSEVRDATVLLAPHHGRKNEFCQEFFDCVNPQLTVISDKLVEHNTQENSAQLYKGRGINWKYESGKEEKRYVLTTRNDGTITFEIGNNKCYISTDKEGY